MMNDASNYFELSLASLRAIGGWAADCAARALPVYELHTAADSRPRAALEGIRLDRFVAAQPADPRPRQAIEAARVDAWRDHNDPIARNGRPRHGRRVNEGTHGRGPSGMPVAARATTGCDL